MLPLGVYVHFPYCLQICPYCDFAVTARKPPQERFTEAVIAELRRRAPGFQRERRVASIYFGGGTPSLWDPRHVGCVIREVRELFAIDGAAEVTLEANPENTGNLSAYRDIGVNRVSLGVQSFDARQLHALGRLHAPEQAERAVHDAIAAGIGAVSVDLIHGAEGQTPQMAAADAENAAALGAQHVSCYALTLTALAVDVPMARAVRLGRLTLPDDDAQASMGESLRAALGAAGLRRYEISNFARPGFESVHNGLYWSGAEYVAVGPGAAGFRVDRTNGLRGIRMTNDRSATRWMDAVLAGGLAETSEDLGAEDLVRERIFTGLRRVAGVDLAEIESWSGVDVRGRYAAVLDRLVREGLAALHGSRLRLTERGLDLHSEAALRFF